MERVFMGKWKKWFLKGGKKRLLSGLGLNAIPPFRPLI
jgi:hypothetical protein